MTAVSLLVGGVTTVTTDVTMRAAERPSRTAIRLGPNRPIRVNRKEGPW